MLDKKLEEAVSGFIQQRINDHGSEPNENLREAYQDFEKCMAELHLVLPPEQENLFIALENAYSLVDGETMNTYYYAGFTDAVLFMNGWRNGEWK